MTEHLLGAALAAVVLASAPALAQPRDADAELEALIPDRAIDDSEGWVQQAAPPEPPATTLDPASPLAAGAGFALPWPDEEAALPALVSLEPEPDLARELAGTELPEAVRPAGEVSRLSSRVSLAYPSDPAAFPERDKFEERFESLSAIEQLSGKGEGGLAQLAVRARSDRDLLGRLLRVYGYYDADIIQTVGGIEPGQETAGEAATVRFDIVPGSRYRFGTIDLGRIAEAGPDMPMLRESFGIRSGDPLYTDVIVTERIDLDVALGENGYAFAKVGEPDLLVDHRREEGDLTVPVEPGGKYRFGAIASSLPRFLSSKHLQEIARFDPGDVYKRSEADDLRRAILATGLVSSVTVTPRETRPPQAGEPGEVALDVELAKAPLRTISGAVGYDTAEGPRIEASWEHRNLFPPEGLLRVRGVLGTKEQLAGVTFRRNNFRGRDQVLTFDLYASMVDRDAYEARTVAFSGSFEKLTTLIFQKPWTWAAGVELVATNEREGAVAGVNTPRATYLIAALPLRAAYDGSDNLLDPTRGMRAALRVSPELSRVRGGQHVYARIQADASYYQPVGGKVVLAARARLGSIPGTAIANIAPSRRFYAGGGGSVRGYGYQEIGPRDTLGDPSGGRSLSEFSVEARVKTGLFDGALSVVPFVDAGAVDVGATPRLRDIRYGAGIGARFATSFGPIRVDVATPLNRRPGDSRVGVYVALGQAF